MPDQIGIATQTISAKKAILLAAFGGLVMSIGFITHNWQKIMARFSGPMISSSVSRSGSANQTENSQSRKPVSEVDVSAPLSLGKVADVSPRNFTELLKLPVSERPPLRFRGLQTMTEQPMKTDEWSREVVIPSAKPTWWSLEVNPPDGYYIRFGNDSIFEIVTGKESVGNNRPPFRLLGKSPGQTAIVRISNKPFKIPQNP